MKKLLTLIGLMVAITILSGCANTEAKYGKAQYKANRDAYYGQQRMGQVLALKTAPDSKISIEGQIELAVSAPLRELGQPAIPPDHWGNIINGVTSVAKWIAGGYFGSQMIDSLAVTRDPVIVEQPPPLIVAAPAP